MSFALDWVYLWISNSIYASTRCMCVCVHPSACVILAASLLTVLPIGCCIWPEQGYWDRIHKVNIYCLCFHCIIDLFLHIYTVFQCPCTYNTVVKSNHEPTGWCEILVYVLNCMYSSSMVISSLQRTFVHLTICSVLQWAANHTYRLFRKA